MNSNNNSNIIAYLYNFNEGIFIQVYCSFVAP